MPRRPKEDAIPSKLTVRIPPETERRFRKRMETDPDISRHGPRANVQAALRKVVRMVCERGSYFQFQQWVNNGKGSTLFGTPSYPQPPLGGEECIHYGLVRLKKDPRKQGDWIDEFRILAIYLRISPEQLMLRGIEMYASENLDRLPKDDFTPWSDFLGRLWFLDLPASKVRPLIKEYYRRRLKAKRGVRSFQSAQREASRR